MIKHILKLIWNKKGSNSLMVLEIFLSFLVLFAVLSYMLFNTDRLASPIGFSTEHQKYVLMGDLPHFDSLERVQAIKDLKIALEELELVEEVSFSNSVHPFSGNTWQTGNDDNGFEMSSRYIYVDMNFAETNDMNIVEGRWFNEDDFIAAYPPMIVNQHFMDEYYSDKSMVDSIIQFNGEKRIVGVVDDFRYGGEFEELRNTSIFLVRETHPYVEVAYLKLDPSADVQYEEEINEVVQAGLKSTSFVIQDAQKMRERTTRETWIPIIALLSICTFLCLNVALGLFGVLSYNISKRKGEIGLRRALGAHGGSITSQFTLEIVLLAGIAIFIGVFFAVQVPLLEVLPIDPWIFYRGIIYAALIILFIVTVCALYPSSQAAKIHPAIALHED